MPGISDGRIPGDVEPPEDGGGEAGACAGGGGAGTAAGAAWTRGIVGTLSRPVSMLISPYSSSSMAAVGNDAAGRPGAGAGAEAAGAGAGAPPRSTSRTLSIIAVVSHGLLSWPSAPAF